MSNQRRSGRAPLDIYLNKYVAGVPYMARALDIGPEGLRLNKLIEPDRSPRRVGLQFQLPGSEEVIYAEGELVRAWAESDGRERPERPKRLEGHGVRFTLLTERHRRMIQAYVDRHAQAA